MPTSNWIHVKGADTIDARRYRHVSYFYITPQNRQFWCRAVQYRSDAQGDSSPYGRNLEGSVQQTHTFEPGNAGDNLESTAKGARHDDGGAGSDNGSYFYSRCVNVSPVAGATIPGDARRHP